ncbi:unnamed protein product [Pedinophyceae sp. YPF-701]|nr:unnamed protein product [Pedinophyceae sp. YPF-701]
MSPVAAPLSGRVGPALRAAQRRPHGPALRACDRRETPKAQRAVAVSASRDMRVPPGCVATLCALAVSFAPAADAKELLTEFAASGFIFKDTVEVVSLPDPEVAGVSIYISDFKRSIADKLAKDFFNEPSQASLTCAATGPVSFDAKRISAPDGQEIFSEAKGLNLFRNKTLRVRRILDKDANALVYVAYSTRTTAAQDDGGPSSGRYRTSICAVPLGATANAANGNGAAAE